MNGRPLIFEKEQRMSNRYAIHLETPSGLQFDGMVEAESVYEAASKWGWDLDRDVPRGAAIVVQDPNYNEEGKLRFTVLAPNGRTDVYGATECIYVASEFDPKALFREMAVHHEKPAKLEPIDDFATRQAMREKVERDSVMVRNFKEALSALKDRRDFLSEKGFVQFLISNEHAMQIVLETEKQDPEPIDHDFAAAKEVRPAESASLRIWLAKDESNLNKQMDSASENWPGVGGPYCFDVEIGDGDATIVGGDPDPLYRGEISAVSKTNKHGAGIRIRRDAQDDYIYIFPSLGAYPKEDADRVRTYSIKKLFQGEPGGAETELALVVAESMESAARKWAKAFSLSPEGKEKTDVVCVARSSAGTPRARFKITNKSMNDSDIVYFNNELYSISEHRRKPFADDGSVPEGAPKAVSYNDQFTVKLDSTPDSEECRKQFEQAVMRACRERFDEQP